METVDPAIWQMVLQLGGAPVAILIAARLTWTHMAEKMDKLERTLERLHDSVQQMDRRLLTIEVQNQIEP